MKTCILSFVFVLLFACVVQAQDVELSCSNGQCSLQRSAPVAATAGAAVRVATAPVRYVTRTTRSVLKNRPVRSFVFQAGACRTQGRFALSFVRRLSCCR